MKDTPDYILQKQLEIIRPKSIEERVQMTFDMVQFVHDMADMRVKRKMPNISKRDLVAQRFMEICERDFST